ncbi:MAG TPA: ABC transporter ATP-binding protein [Caulobacteraceae bacterium]
MSPRLELRGVSVLRGGQTVLDGVNLTVQAGEVVGVVGPNGAGKTTLLRAALGLQPLAGGAARLGGEEVRRLSPAELARRAGYLPQERRLAWNVHALQAAGLGAMRLSQARAEAVATEALAKVGLGHLASRGVFDMSGGERARVLLARLLASGAPLLLADELTAGLDPDAQLLAIGLMRAEAMAGAAVVLTLHDLSLAARACDRLVVLDRGRIAAEGPPEQALSPAVLGEVFGLDGQLIDTPAGPVLAARRRGDAA